MWEEKVKSKNALLLQNNKNAFTVSNSFFSLPGGTINPIPSPAPSRHNGISGRGGRDFLLDDDERLRPQRRRRSVAHRLRCVQRSRRLLFDEFFLTKMLLGHGNLPKKILQFRIFLSVPAKCRKIFSSNFRSEEEQCLLFVEIFYTVQ